MGWLYNSAFVGLMESDCLIKSREHISNYQHAKRKLRQGYVKEYGQNGIEDLMMPLRVKAAVKLEIAKTGKVGRLTGAYEAGSMYAAELPEYLKMCLKEEIVLCEKGTVFRIFLLTKPKNDKMCKMFAEVYRGLPQGEAMICIYSDDSVWHIGGVSGCTHNVDISACDKSVKSAGFFMNGLIMSAFDVERAIGLIEQCKKPITMKNSDGTAEMSWWRMVDGIAVPIETSGTVLTTGNNFCIMLICALVFVYRGVYTADGIAIAGLLVGINLDISQNLINSPESVQFLKRSPMMTEDGEIVLAQNLGCMLRGFGKFFGDMEAKSLCMTHKQFMNTSWHQRFEVYLSNVVAGLIHEPGSVVLDALRERFRTPTGVVESSYKIVSDGHLGGKRLDDASVAARYGVSTYQLAELAEEIRHLKLGSIIVSETLTAIYQADYSL